MATGFKSCDEFACLAEPFCDHIVNMVWGVVRQLLFQGGNFDALRYFNDAFISRLNAADNFQQGRFTATIAAQQGDFFPWLDVQINAVKQGVSTKCQG